MIPGPEEPAPGVPHLDVATIPTDARIERWHAASLVFYTNQVDPRVEMTDPNIDIWFEALRGGTFGIALKVIRDYYRRYDPKAPQPDKLTPGYIRHKAADESARQKRLTAGPRKRPQKGRMPRHVLLRLQAAGQLRDRDPNDYPERHNTQP